MDLLFRFLTCVAGTVGLILTFMLLYWIVKLAIGMAQLGF